MGYRTWVNIEVWDFDPAKEPNPETTERQAFTEVVDEELFGFEEYDDKYCQAAGEDNNGWAIDQLVKNSKRHPGLLLEGSIDGAAEDSNDQRLFRIRNGRIEVIEMETFYEPFTELLGAHEVPQMNSVRLVGRVTGVEKNDGQEYLRLVTSEPDGTKLTHYIREAEKATEADYHQLYDGHLVYVTGRICYAKIKTMDFHSTLFAFIEAEMISVRDNRTFEA